MVKIKKYFSLPLSLITVLIFVNSTGFIQPLPSIVQAVFFAFIIALMIRKQPIIEPFSRNFILWLPICTLLAFPDSVFHSWERLALFYTVYLVLSPFFQGEWHRGYRKKLLDVTILICIIVSVISFFCYFLGINLFVRKEVLLDDYLEYAGHFSGITRHSMILGPLAGIGSVSCIYYFIRSRNIIWVLSFLCCCGSMLFSASRTCFICTIASSIMIIYKYSFTKKNFIKISLGIIAVGILSFPLWSGALWGLQAKQAGHSGSGELFDSRTAKVLYRFEEFVDSPIWGQGFSAIDINLGDAYDPFTGTIEPGTSWLFALSSTGIVGLILLVILFRKSLLTTIISYNERSMLLSSLLVFIGLHLFTEGYLFASSNVMSLIAWLIIGCGYDLNYEDDFLKFFSLKS